MIEALAQTIAGFVDIEQAIGVYELLFTWFTAVIFALSLNFSPGAHFTSPALQF